MTKKLITSSAVALTIAAFVIPMTSSAAVAPACQILNRDLQMGSRDQKVIKDVTNLQNFLKYKGVLKKTSGSFGGGTVEAVKKYQKATGLPVTGKINSIDRAKINADSCTQTNVSVHSDSLDVEDSDVEVIRIDLKPETSTGTTTDSTISNINLVLEGTSFEHNIVPTETSTGNLQIRFDALDIEVPSVNLNNAAATTSFRVVTREPEIVVTPPINVPQLSDEDIVGISF